MWFTLWFGTDHLGLVHYCFPPWVLLHFHQHQFFIIFLIRVLARRHLLPFPPYSTNYAPLASFLFYYIFHSTILMSMGYVHLICIHFLASSSSYIFCSLVQSLWYRFAALFLWFQCIIVTILMPHTKTMMFLCHISDPFISHQGASVNTRFSSWWGNPTLVPWY